MKYSSARRRTSDIGICTAGVYREGRSPAHVRYGWNRSVTVPQFLTARAGTVLSAIPGTTLSDPDRSDTADSFAWSLVSVPQGSLLSSGNIDYRSGFSGQQDPSRASAVLVTHSEPATPVMRLRPYLPGSAGTDLGLENLKGYLLRVPQPADVRLGP